MTGKQRSPLPPTPFVRMKQRVLRLHLVVVAALALFSGTGCRTIEEVTPISDRTVPWPILFVHGLGSAPTAWETDGTIAYFERRGLRYGGIVRGTQIRRPISESPPGQDLFTVGFTDPFGNLEVWAQELAAAIGSVRQLTGAEKVILVCHSAGGIAARRFLVDHPLDHTVHRLVTIATPHTGTELARLVSLKHAIMSRPELALFRSRMERIEHASRLPLDATVLAQLQPVDRNPWLDRLNRAPHPTDVQYVAIVVEHGRELSVWADLDADMKRFAENPVNSTLVNRLLHGLLEVLSDSTRQVGDGVVLANRQRLSRVSWFERSRTPVEEIRVFSRTHQDALTRTFEIASAVSGVPRVLSVKAKRRFLRPTSRLQVDVSHEFGAGMAVMAYAMDSGSSLGIPVSQPQLAAAPDRTLVRVEIGPFRPHSVSEIDLRMAPPGLPDLYVAPLVRRHAAEQPRLVGSLTRTVHLQLESVIGVPNDADPLLVGRFRGADVQITLATADGQVLTTKEYPDVTTGTVLLDEPGTTLALDPLRTRLHLYIWDVDPLSNTLLGSAVLEPGEWPNGPARIATAGSVTLLARLDWSAEPTMHFLPPHVW